MGIKFIFIISYRRPANTKELWISSSVTSFGIGGPPIPGSYRSQVRLPHLVSAGRRYQGTMVLKFILVISYRQPPIPGNYCHQFQLHHLVSAARRYHWNSETSCWSLTFYRPIACRCRWIRSSLPCFVVLYRRIDPSYGQVVTEPPFTPPCRHSPLREHSCALDLTQLSLLRSSSLCPFHNADRKPTHNASLSVSVQCPGSLSCVIT